MEEKGVVKSVRLRGIGVIAAKQTENLNPLF